MQNDRMLTRLVDENVLRQPEAAGESEGFVAWKRLLTEYEPQTVGRHAGLLLELLH